MRVRHPYALEDDAPPLDGSVHYAPRRSADVDPETGIFELPNDKRGWLDRWAARYGYDGSELIVTDESPTVIEADSNASDTPIQDAADEVGLDSPESDSSADTGSGSDESEDGTCGYYDPDTMDAPCKRTAGWGRDADTGRCKDHAE